MLVPHIQICAASGAHGHVAYMEQCGTPYRVFVFWFSIANGILVSRLRGHYQTHSIRHIVIFVALNILLMTFPYMQWDTHRHGRAREHGVCTGIRIRIHRRVVWRRYTARGVYVAYDSFHRNSAVSGIWFVMHPHTSELKQFFCCFVLFLGSHRVTHVSNLEMLCSNFVVYVLLWLISLDSWIIIMRNNERFFFE